MKKIGMFLLVALAAGCQTQEDVDKVVEGLLEPDLVAVKMVINNLGRSNPDYICRDDISYTVEVVDSEGKNRVRGYTYKANKEFEVSLRPGKFTVSWKVVGSSSWLSSKNSSTSAKQPIELACLGKGVSGGGGT